MMAAATQDVVYQNTEHQEDTLLKEYWVSGGHVEQGNNIIGFCKVPINEAVKATASEANKPYVCNVCFKTFSRNFTLKEHQRVHTKEKPYVCSMCNRGFSENSTYRRHIRTHTKETPYICSVCQRGFSQNGTLKRHMMTHTNEKPYICLVCQKTFTRDTTLKEHYIRLHNPEKNHICHLCNKAFSVARNLKKHLDNHEKPKKDPAPKPPKPPKPLKVPKNSQGSSKKTKKNNSSSSGAITNPTPNGNTERKRPIIQMLKVHSVQPLKSVRKGKSGEDEEVEEAIAFIETEIVEEDDECIIPHSPSHNNN